MINLIERWADWAITSLCQINWIRKKRQSTILPTLQTNGKYYETNEEKAILFASILKNTFADSNDEISDEKQKNKIETDFA